jgi:hypothetical protein
MKRQRYYPSRFAEQIPWLENFRTKIGGYVVTLGLDPAKATAIVGDCRFAIYVLSQWLPAARAFTPASTYGIDQILQGEGADPMVLPVFTAPALPAGVTAVPPGVLTRLFDFVEEIKAADAYDDTIGSDLGLIGSEIVSSQPAPTIKCHALDGSVCSCVRIIFVKFGHMGVYIESRRNGGAWEFLGIDTETPTWTNAPSSSPAHQKSANTAPVSGTRAPPTASGPTWPK